MKRRHSGHSGHSNHMGGGGMGNHRRQQQGRHFQKGGQPRKNFPALREKYLNLAKDAMSMGDRVLAEYYLQHADHYYRMQQEFHAERAQRQQLMTPAEAAEDTQREEAAQDEAESETEVNITNNSSVLPAFLTRQMPAQQQEAEQKAAAAASWEEE